MGHKGLVQPGTQGVLSGWQPHLLLFESSEYSTGIKHGSVEGPDGQLARELHKTGIFHLLMRLGLEGLWIFAQCPGNKSLSFMGILMKGWGEMES